MALSTAASVAVYVIIPVVPLVYFHKKYALSFKAVGVGALVFIIFALVLERLVHLYFLQLNLTTALFLEGNPFIYAVYGGLMAGMFEETGRYLAFRYILKGKRDWKDGLAYGIGHGGIECISVGVTVLLLVAINDAAVPTVLSLGQLERVMALIVQIALSLIVIYGVKSGRIRFLFYAVLGHATLDFFAGLAQKGVITPWVAEVVVALYAVAGIWLVMRLKTAFTVYDAAEGGSTD